MSLGNGQQSPVILSPSPQCTQTLVHGPVMRSDCHYSTFRVDVTEWAADPRRVSAGTPRPITVPGVGRGSFPGPGSSSSPRQRPGLSRFSYRHLTVLPAALKGSSDGEHTRPALPHPHISSLGEKRDPGWDARDPCSVHCLREFQHFLPRCWCEGMCGKGAWLLSWG